MTALTRSAVEHIIREARERGEVPDLRKANLYETDLYGADLRGADLRWTDLHGTDLRGADLCWTDLHGADLRWTDLREANLRGANLRWTTGVVSFGTTPSGPAHMIPLPNGTWELTIGCWNGTITDLRALIAGTDWPNAEGDEQDRRRPILAALADLADAQAAYHHDWLTATVDTWGAAEHLHNTAGESSD